MNNISNQIEQLNQEQMRLYQEMTKLISEACKKKDLHLVGEILRKYKPKIEAINNEIDEISRQSGLNNLHRNR